MIGLINLFLDYYLLVYKYSIYLLLLLLWYFLSFVNRGHLRLLTHQLGRYINCNVEYVARDKLKTGYVVKVLEFIKNNVIKQLCIIMDILTGFVGGIEGRNDIINVTQVETKSVNTDEINEVTTTCNVFTKNELTNNNYEEDLNYADDDNNVTENKDDREDREDNEHEENNVNINDDLNDDVVSSEKSNDSCDSEENNSDEEEKSVDEEKQPDTKNKIVITNKQLTKETKPKVMRVIKITRN